MKTPLDVLIVEDSPDNAELAMIEFRRAGCDRHARHVETREAMALPLDGMKRCSNGAVT